MLVLDVCARTCAEERGCAVPGRGLGMAWYGWRSVGLSLSGERGVRASDRRRSSGARRGRAPCGAWRNASQRPCVPRPNTRGGHGGHEGPRPATTLARARRRSRSRPGRRAAAPTPGAPGRTGNSILAKMVQGPFCFRGDHRSAHAPASLFDARQRLRTRTSAVCCLVCDCVSLDLCHLASICRAAMLIFAGARPTHGR